MILQLIFEMSHVGYDLRKTMYVKKHVELTQLQHFE